MNKSFIFVFLCFFLIGCKSVTSNIQSVTVDTLMTDKISIRAIAVADGKVYYAGNKSRLGYVDLLTRQKKEIIRGNEKADLEFRSLALTGDALVVANVGNPAYFFKVQKSMQFEDIQPVYQEIHEKVFYDSMQFWNPTEGIAIGDPIDDCFCILITRDAGQSWNKIPCENLPKLAQGEAAFAASNTNIVVNGNHTWLVSGGSKARVFHSPDKGKSWSVYQTPIVQGEAMTGIFTADFYNDKIGFIAGGNYEKPTQNAQNKALTTDGGKTWQLVGENTGFGYASCIQFVPKSNGKQLVCAGSTGVYYSNDRGNSWRQISTDTSLYTLRFVDSHTFVAAGKDKIVQMTLK